jgi:hypothetical protein
MSQNNSPRAARATMPVTRLLLRMTAADNPALSTDARAALVNTLRNAGWFVKNRGQKVADGLASEATPDSAVGDAVDMAFELFDETELVEKMCALTTPESLTAPLATEILAALARYARA